MTIRYKCEECGAALNINDELAGTEGSCPRCHVEFVVPSADGGPEKPAKVEKPRVSSSGSLNTEEEIGDFLSSDEIPVVAGRKPAADDDETASDDDNPFDDETPRSRKKPAGEDTEHDDELEAAVKKKTRLKEGSARKKGDSHDSAEIARTLMGKGQQPLLQEEIEPDKKKKRRQFGGESERPKGEITSVGDIVKQAAKLGWPALVGATVIVVFFAWIFGKMQKRLDLPPLAKVSGTVTIDGRPVAASTIVKFLPEAATTNLKLGASFGFTDDKGKYTLQYTNEYRGAVIGKHRVLVEGSDPTQGIPDRYKSTLTSDLAVEVTNDGKPIDISLKSDPVPAE